MITIERLSLIHGLHNLTLTLPKNRLIGVLGANGAGKSSLLKSIAGITPPTQGRIIIDGQNADNLSHRQRWACLHRYRLQPNVKKSTPPPIILVSPICCNNKCKHYQAVSALGYIWHAA